MTTSKLTNPPDPAHLWLIDGATGVPHAAFRAAGQRECHACDRRPRWGRIEALPLGGVRVYFNNLTRWGTSFVDLDVDTFLARLGALASRPPPPEAAHRPAT